MLTVRLPSPRLPFGRWLGAMVGALVVSLAPPGTATAQPVSASAAAAQESSASPGPLLTGPHWSAEPVLTRSGRLPPVGAPALAQASWTQPSWTQPPLAASSHAPAFLAKQASAQQAFGQQAFGQQSVTVQPAPPGGWAAPSAGAWSPGSPLSRTANTYEIAGLYASSAAWGLGLGIWIDAEFGLREPGVVIIPPTVLAVAAPITARLLNRPRMPRGMPAAISAGITLGAGEALALVGLVNSTSSDGWGLRSSMRAITLASTAGGAAGYILGRDQLPSPNLSAFALTGATLGSVIGAMYGFGASREGGSFSQANGSLATGTFIGLNVGVLTTGLLSTLFVPSVDELRWTWIGAAAGAVVSLPAYLFYVGSGAPPLKRGLIFSGTATTLGAVAGGILGPELGGEWARRWFGGRHAQITGVSPLPLPGGMGLSVQGTLF